MAVLLRLLIPAALIGLTVYAVFDAIKTEESQVQHLPKIIWVFLILLFPPIGPLAWLLLGRPEREGYHPGPVVRRRAPRGPDGPAPEQPRMDRETYERKRRDAIRRYEDEKRRRDRPEDGSTA